MVGRMERDDWEPIELAEEDVFATMVDAMRDVTEEFGDIDSRLRQIRRELRSLVALSHAGDFTIEEEPELGD